MLSVPLKVVDKDMELVVPSLLDVIDFVVELPNILLVGFVGILVDLCFWLIDA